MDLTTAIQATFFPGRLPGPTKLKQFWSDDPRPKLAMLENAFSKIERGEAASGEERQLVQEYGRSVIEIWEWQFVALTRTELAAMDVLRMRKEIRVRQRSLRAVEAAWPSAKDSLDRDFVLFMENNILNA